ncbi:MAG: hypothetical protein ABI717_05590 [Actinomycetota bacterium]
MRKLLVAFGALAVLVPAAVPAANVNSELAAVRQATAKYHQVGNALAAGYVADPFCVESPAGGMGFHYVNPALVMDPAIDPLRPEALLYAPSGNGLRLVAVEWLQFSNVFFPAPAPTAPKQSLFGREFDGWMPGHSPVMPWHAELHAWIWQANPVGIFASWNPNVGC